MSNWILPAFLAFVCWGVWGFIPKITTRYISPMSAMVYETIGALIVGLVCLALVGFKPDTDIKGICLAVSTGVIGLTGALFFLFAVKSGKVSVVAMITALSPVITIGLGYLILKEPLSLREGLGVLSAFIAIILFTT